MEIPVVRPPWSDLGRRMESSIRKALYDYEMLEGVKKVAIALSGGKDSLSLLYFMRGLMGRGFPDLDIVAVHVHGAFSCGAGVDIGYLKAICEGLGVELLTRESHQELDTLECYSCSRERRKLLFDAAKSAGAETIAFGHHRDDNAQTILMNMLHKAEFCGHLPKLHMVDYGVTIIRPMTYIAEDDIRTFSKMYGFARVMCRCPVGQNSMRRKVDDLLKEIELLYPHARANIAKAGLNYGSDKAKRK